MPPSPAPRPDSRSPYYLLALAVGSVAFVLGAVTAALMYAVGGKDMVVGGIIVGVLVFALAYTLILRLREG